MIPQRLAAGGPQLDAKGVLPKRPLRLGTAESLAVMDGFVFFSPAILYIHGALKDAMLLDFIRNNGTDVPLFFHRFGSPVFGGLQAKTGDVGWNHGLMALAAENWEAFSGFMTSITVVHRDTKQVIRYALQELTIVDPLAREKHQILDGSPVPLTIGMFGLDGAQCRIAMTQPDVKTYDLPRLKVHPPTAEMKAYAKAYFAGANPLHAEEITEAVLIAKKNAILAEGRKNG